MSVEIDLLEQRLNDLTSSIDKMSGKLDQIIHMQLEIARLQEQQENSRQAMSRAFDRIDTVDWRSTSTETALSRAMSFIRGALAVGTLLFIFAQWYAIDQIQDVKKAKNEVQVIERRLTLIERDIQREWSSNP